MRDWLTVAAQVNPNATALISEDGLDYTYEILNEWVTVMCASLLEIGVKRGQYVGVLMTSSFEYVFLVHALARVGAVIVPLNVRLTSEELQYQIEKAQCICVICNQPMEHQAVKLKTKIFSVDESQNATVVSISLGILPIINFHPVDYFEGEISLEDTQAIVFTSGTTGKPKGAQITFANHFWSAMASAYRLGTLPDDRWLTCLPLYHVGGLAIILRCCLYGTTVVLHDGFDVENVRRALAEDQITLISLVPTMLYRLLEAGELKAPHLRLILLGGAAASPELIERCRELNLPVATTYGLTEACSQVATLLPDEVRRKPGSVGKPLPFTSVRIADENGHTIPYGQYGEVIVSGQTVMKCYFDQPDDRTIRDGELYTGDLGYVDADGDLWLVQRRSDLIVSGGENVYPAEVESVLRQHPAVEEACVVGIENAEWGQQVAAAVVLKTNAAVSTDELISFCRSHLAGYKQPRLIRVVEALPQTASGKIHRRAVADLLSQVAKD